MPQDENEVVLDISDSDSDVEMIHIDDDDNTDDLGPRRAMNYAPPPYAPHQKPLLEGGADGLQYAIDLDQLARDGWTTLPIENKSSDPLYGPFLSLFEASSSFLSMPEEKKKAYCIRASEDFQVSEEGYSRVEGEKCMIAPRKAQTTPTEFGMREKADEAWKAGGQVMHAVLAAIERSCGMTEGALTRTTEAQLSLPREGKKNVATLMRMFQYDRPLPPQTEPKVVAEHHKDLGLLTIVIGHSPGLECWNNQTQEFVSTETHEGLNASILVGQTLAKFTNDRFKAGRHRVFVHPSPVLPAEAASYSSPLQNPIHRYSLVHTLRAHFPVRVTSEEFETPVTGAFPNHLRFSSSVSEIYKAISGSHWNINITKEDRRRQEDILLERARMQMEAMRIERTETRTVRNGEGPAGLGAVETAVVV